MARDHPRGRWRMGVAVRMSVLLCTCRACFRPGCRATRFFSLLFFS